MAGDCMIEWHIDWEAFERYPKHKQEEILACEHDWHDYLDGFNYAYSECKSCGCPRHEVIA